MRPGISSFAFGWAVAEGAPPMDELALIDFARRHGAVVVQLGDHLPVHKMSAERRARLTEAARAAGLRLELGARGMTVAHLRAFVALCVEVGSPFLRFVVDEGHFEPSAEEIVETLRAVRALLETSGVTLGIENHDRLSALTLREIIELAASPNIGVCLDTANSFGAGEDLEHVTTVLAPVTVNLHVKDVAIRRLPHMMGFTIEGRPLGEGLLAIRKTIAAVRQTARCHSAIVELWTPPEPVMADTVAKEAHWAAQSLATLKGMLEEAV